MSGCGVLLIDDDSLSREILELLLGEAGYTVVSAGSGEEALAVLRSGTAPPAVLADLQMPGLSGAELAAEIRELAPATALLAMSGSEPKLGLPQGYGGFLLKPFTMEELGAALESVRVGPVSSQPAEAKQGETDRFRSPESASPGASPVLDEVKLRQLLASFRPAQIEELFRFALTDAERQLETMRQAQADGDDASYRRCAHSLKGSFGMLGAPEVWGLAADAEREGINHPAKGVTTLVLFSGALSRLQHTLDTRGICHF